MSMALGRVVVSDSAAMIPTIVATVPRYRVLAEQRGYDFAATIVAKDQAAATRRGRRQGMLEKLIPNRVMRSPFTTWQVQSEDHSLRKLEVTAHAMSLVSAYAYVGAIPLQSIIAWIGAKFQNTRGSSRVIEVDGLPQRIVEAHPQPTTVLVNALHVSTYAPDPHDGMLLSITNSAFGNTNPVIEAHNLLDAWLEAKLRYFYVNLHQGILAMHDVGRTPTEQECIDFVTAQWSNYRGKVKGELQAFLVEASGRKGLSDKEGALLQLMVKIAKSELVITTEVTPATLVPASQRATIELLEDSVASGITYGTTPSTQAIAEALPSAEGSSSVISAAVHWPTDE
jgi:hypothetical protein